MANIGLTVMTFSASYFGIKQPALFRSRNLYQKAPEEISEPILDEPLPTKISDEPKNNAQDSENEGNYEKEKYKRSGLKEEDAERYISRLMAYMEKEKPFIDAEMTIQDLSARINISKHHLTQILNNNLGKNFFTFVNEFRIEEVKWN